MAIKPLALAIASSSLMMSTPGFAQGSGLVLEEVIVTAQKRSESGQDIAASVSVVGGEQLQEFNIFDFFLHPH